MKIKHDLSAGQAKVHFELLLQVAQIAVAQTRIACERSLGQLQTAHFQNNFNDLENAAQDLATNAANLATAAHTLHILEESISRPEFILIGKPDVPPGD